MLREFNNSDWDGFAGAEPFADGSQPLIGEVSISDWEEPESLVVADQRGMEIYMEIPKVQLQKIWRLDATGCKFWSPSVARAIAPMLTTTKALEEAGFEPYD